jgi:ABC-2 type transport system permease protein
MSERSTAMLVSINEKVWHSGLCGRLLNFLRLAGVYVGFNFKSQIEYRSAFISQVAAMLINDCFWLAFWLFFFQRFPVLGGWNCKDVVVMWAIVAAGYGVAHGIAGNAGNIAGIIVKGQLDIWLVYPRAVLPHLLFGRMQVSAWGDVLFGVLVYVLMAEPTLQSLALFLFLVLSAAILFVGFDVLVGSLGFFVGNAEGLSEQLRFALVTFSTYPPSVFDGGAKLVLFTLIPAGFCSYLPVEALKHHSIEYALLSFAGSLLVLFAGVAAFYLGLRRYESGSLMEMRG